MNRYPLWKYLLLLAAVILGILYSLPNYFGDAPAIQVSARKSGVQADEALRQKIETALQAAGIVFAESMVEHDSVIVRFHKDEEELQMKARTVIEQALDSRAENPDAHYIVALNLMPLTPDWLQAIGARPMYLGLDLRGGVHFMMQVDVDAALNSRAESLAVELRNQLREENIRHGGVARKGLSVEIRARDEAVAEAVQRHLAKNHGNLDVQQTPDASGSGFTIAVTFKPQVTREIQDMALEQNMITLTKRVNQLGVAEPVIQRQGLERIVVQLPGIQDTATAKNILGRTATLELRMVDESAEGLAAERGTGNVPFGSERFYDSDGRPTIVYREVVLTGENLSNAQPAMDENQRPAVSLTLDGAGSSKFRDVTRRNIGKRMAIILFEDGRGEVVTAPVIRSEIPGGRVQISGNMTSKEAANVALLLRSGSLAAPMKIIEERTIGPSLGKENIERGKNSVLWGFIVIAVFMCLYYQLFGVIASISMTVNLLLLVAILSVMQATMTLPGIAALALAIGVAIDSNVLINERIREELRAGTAPQTAIYMGYDRAWATIVDSNVTTLIAGLALLAFGSGPIRGFAVVHCLGILTSMFSAVFCSRGLVNLIYGRRKKLQSLSIGQVWKPENDDYLTVAGRQEAAEKD